MKYYGKANIFIRVKDFPTGKSLRCHMMLDEGNSWKTVPTVVADYLTGDNEFTKKYSIHNYEITDFYHISYISHGDKLGEIVIDKEYEADGNSTLVPPKPKEEPKFDIKKASDDDLMNMRNTINVEMYKRQHNLSEEEYKFFVDNMDSVSIDRVKEMFRVNKTDPFKIKKDNIREIIKKKEKEKETN